MTPRVVIPVTSRLDAVVTPRVVIPVTSRLDAVVKPRVVIPVTKRCLVVVTPVTTMSFDVNMPTILASPATSNVAVGVVEPIPTFTEVPSPEVLLNQ